MPRQPLLESWNPRKGTSKEECMPLEIPFLHDSNDNNFPEYYIPTSCKEQSYLYIYIYISRTNGWRLSSRIRSCYDVKEKYWRRGLPVYVNKSGGWLPIDFQSCFRVSLAKAPLGHRVHSNVDLPFDLFCLEMCIRIQ